MGFVMVMPLTDKLKKFTKALYGAPSDLLDDRPDAQIYVKDSKLFTPRNHESYDAAVAQLNHSLWQVEEALVSKIAVAVMMSQPDLTPEQMEHALFAKQMFRAGEIRFEEYLQKMQNLFPDQMDGLSDDLKGQIHQRMGHI